MISGQYVDKFADASHVMAEGMSLNSPYRDQAWFKIEKWDDGYAVILSNGELFPIHTEGKKQYIWRVVNDPIFGPTGFRYVPFKGVES